MRSALGGSPKAIVGSWLSEGACRVRKRTQEWRGNLAKLIAAADNQSKGANLTHNELARESPQTSSHRPFQSASHRVWQNGERMLGECAGTNSRNLVLVRKTNTSILSFLSEGKYESFARRSEAATRRPAPAVCTTFVSRL